MGSKRSGKIGGHLLQIPILLPPIFRRKTRAASSGKSSYQQQTDIHGRRVFLFKRQNIVRIIRNYHHLLHCNYTIQPDVVGMDSSPHLYRRTIGLPSKRKTFFVHSTSCHLTKSSGKSSFKVNRRRGV